MNILDLVSSTPGAKILGTVLPDAPKDRRKRPKVVVPPPPSTLYPPGEVVARFTVSERAVPWKALWKGKAAPNVKLRAWMAHVRKAARQAMDGRLPHSGRFELRATFRLRPEPSMPDLTNLEKSTEDALQGIVILNDRRTKRKRTDYDDESDVDETTIEIIAL